MSVDMRARSLLAMFLLLGARDSFSQSVRGTALTLDSVAVPGVIVTLLDTTGTAVARALTDGNGKFAIRAPAAGRYRIEAKRLAFRPTLDIPITLENGKILLYLLVLTGSPIELAAIRTVVTPTCEQQPDSASAAFALWEEARKALQASRLTRLTRDYRVDVTSFVRRQGPIAPAVDSETVAGLPIRPFTSRTPDDLEARGYLTRNGLNFVFHAPDEEVLLSESFASTHCLSILPDSGGAGSARLGFAPTSSHTKPDISGVLTLDRATAELRRLDFTYVNLPPLPVDGRRGGEMVFRRLPEGSWLIDEWAIWVPIHETRTEPNPATPAQPQQRGLSARPMPPRVTVSRGIQVTGGHVMRVSRGEETVWRRSAPER